ncbi:polysaccharide deacetylase family protein [Noviherbaspirillum sp. Root189]|uniref:polysaccharide deacetylase family protein n=1 Tax=Noviherbaspirillum sp. Root189 TaxID=1736487 RepID=UPI0009EAA65D|nr:polysaccharide deacetylase family protein [Noviherbaspirillum sp. Root189]
MPNCIPILVYHRIDNERLSTSTSPAVFASHLEWLAKRGWRSLTVSELDFYAARGKRMPARSFLLTFDDGYESVFLEALPVLKSFNFSALCFLSTKSIRHSAVSSLSGSQGDPGFLSWQQIRELQSDGWMEFHSHTHEHRPLSDLTRNELTQDLATSLDHLTQELGLPGSHFRHLAWPWGESHDESRQIAARLGFQYQYTVARSGFLHSSPLQNVPRTCYDGATLTNFVIQFQLQTGICSSLWHAGYPLVRKVRRPGFSIAFRDETSSVQVTAPIRTGLPSQRDTPNIGKAG